MPTPLRPQSPRQSLVDDPLLVRSTLDGASPVHQVVAMLFDPWPIWVAEHERPDLLGSGVVAIQKDKVVAANANARKQGIELGMKVTGAKVKVPDLVVVPMDTAHLEQSWEALIEELYGYSNRVEPIAQGRVLLTLEVTQARQLAEAYRARVGVGQSREVAVLAALASHQGECRIIAPNAEPGFLAKLPLYFLKGVGLSERSLLNLHRLGLIHVGELATWKKRQLLAYLPEAPNLLPYLHGPGSAQVRTYQPRERLEALHLFEEPALEPFQIEPALYQLAEQLSHQLKGKSARRLTLIAQTSGLAVPAIRLSKEPLREVKPIYRLALLALADTKTAGLPLESLSLELSALYRPTKQAGLWQAKRNYDEAVEAILARYPELLVKASPHNPYSIAPEYRYFWQEVHGGSLHLPEVIEPPVWAEEPYAPPVVESRGFAG